MTNQVSLRLNVKSKYPTLMKGDEMRSSTSTISRVVVFGLTVTSVFGLKCSIAEAQRVRPPEAVPKGLVITLDRVRPDVAELKALPSGRGFEIGSLMEFSLPTANTSLRFGVAARDADLNFSMPTEIIIAI